MRTSRTHSEPIPKLYKRTCLACTPVRAGLCEPGAPWRCDVPPFEETPASQRPARTETPASQRPARSRLRLGCGGFTVAELVVAVGIMAGLMTLVAMIFSTAAKSSGIAQSSTRLYREYRQVTDFFRHDLDSMDPPTHMLAIAGVEVLAHRTPNDQQSGRPPEMHRADVLMMFTKRQGDPFVADLQQIREDLSIDIAISGAVQVVYGHADFDELNPEGVWPDPLHQNAKRVEGSGGSGQSDMPASTWHLARRVIGFPLTTLPDWDSEDWPDGIAPKGGVATLTDLGFLDATYDVFGDPYDDPADPPDPLSVAKRIPQGLFHYVGGVTEDCYHIDYSVNPNGYRYRHDGGGRYLFHDKNWWRRGGSPEDWIRQEWEWNNPGSGQVEDVDSPRDGGNPLPDDTFALADFNHVPADFFYNAGAVNRRTIIDPSPPVGATERMACHFLPRCSEFKVEYTYDDPREIAIRPDTREPFADEDIDWFGDPSPDRVPRPMPVRWQSVPNGEQMVWSKLSIEPNDYGADDPRNAAFPYRWPRAVRITMRAYPEGDPDPDDEPVTQTIIHTWE